MNNQPVIDKVLGTATTNPFWKADNEQSIHMTMKVDLDHEIEADKLLKALEDTCDVWPILRDEFVEMPDGRICMVQSNKPLKIHHSPVAVAPGAGQNENRILAVTYDGKSVFFTGMHAFFDGGSVLMLMRNVISRYLSAYAGRPLKTGKLPAKGEGDKAEYSEFYAVNSKVMGLPFQKADPLPIVSPIFKDPRLCYGVDQEVAFVKLAMPSDPFMAFCKQSGATPSVMLFTLFAKAMFLLNSDAELPVVANNTMNIRKALGLELSLLGQTMGSQLVMEKTALDRPLPEVAKELRSMLDVQRSTDYILSRADDMRQHIPSLSFKYSFAVVYLGKMDFGEATQYVKDLDFYSDSVKNVGMYEMRNTFEMFIQFGCASEDYAHAVMDILKEAGVPSEIVYTARKLPAEIR